MSIAYEANSGGRQGDDRGDMNQALSHARRKNKSITTSVEPSRFGKKTNRTFRDGRTVTGDWGDIINIAHDAAYFRLWKHSAIAWGADPTSGHDGCGR